MCGIAFVEAGGERVPCEEVTWKAGWTNVIHRKNFRCVPNLLSSMAIELPNGVY